MSIQNNQTDLVEQWKTIIAVQMHFNDMIIRTRTLGVTVVVAVYGAAAASIGQYPKQYIEVLGNAFHISILGILLGILLLASVFIIDKFYYYKLLIGTVEKAEQLEHELNPIEIKGKTQSAGITIFLTEKVSRRMANIIIIIFYGLAFAFGIMFLLYICIAYNPITK
jgi:hypothetical protein